MTTAAVFAPYDLEPLTNQQAWDAYNDLIANDRITLQHEEPAELETHWRRFATRNASSPNLWMDAYLAAFAVAGGYTFVTSDKAFVQFDGLDLVVLEPT